MMNRREVLRMAKALKEERTDSTKNSWKMILAAVGLKLKENGKSDAKIENFIVGIQEYLNEAVANGEDTNSLVQKLEDETGICLVWR